MSILLSIIAITSLAQGSGFSFQGRLNDGTIAANGAYDLQFKLYDAIAGGGQIGSTVSRPTTGLVNGVFSVVLDFGSAAFNNPTAVFIEIAVKPGGSANAYTILGPRQQLTVVPFAVRADRASTADLAGTATLATRAVNASDADRAAVAALAINATTAANALNLGGAPAANFPQLNIVNTGDLRTNGAIAVTGNAFQPITANGFVKAMIEIDFNGNILGCYNSLNNTNSGNCGFIVASPLVGVKRINFGFPIAGRFVAITTKYTNSGGSGINNGGSNYREFDSNSIEVFSFFAGESANTSNHAFTLILY